MSKEEQARVRDELLQGLYRAGLRCELARGASGRSTGKGDLDALAAGVCANLKPDDLLLLPARGAESFHALRRDPAARYLLPPSEAAGVGFALGLATALSRGRLVCVLLPEKTSLDAAPGTQTSVPEDWPGAALYAARHRLPLLLLGGKTTPVGDPEQPGPAYPSIPVDEDDALAVYRVAYECAARVRMEDGGPSHICPVPFRVRGAEAEPGALLRLEAALRRRGAFPKPWRRQMERELIRELTS